MNERSKIVTYDNGSKGYAPAGTPDGLPAPKAREHVSEIVDGAYVLRSEEK